MCACLAFSGFILAKFEGLLHYKLINRVFYKNQFKSGAFAREERARQLKKKIK